MGNKLDKSKINKEELEAIKKVKDYKRICESNIVSILWKDPDLYYDYDNLTLDMFTHNEWKVYFNIGKDLTCVEKKNVLDDITVNLYLEKHEKLKERYIEYGGYETIDLAKTYVKVENLSGYVDELNKWNIVVQLFKQKFPIADRLSEYVDMTSEDIYDEYEAILNHIFVNSSGEEKAYDICDGIDKLIDDLDLGQSVGLPLYNAPILTQETGGNLEGNITLCGGLSGVGKTALTKELILPSIAENDEKIVIMINEESLSKWQQDLLIWVANNIYNNDTQKYKLRNGGYTKEFKSFLKDKCAKWIKDNKNKIIVIPFKKFSANKSIKYIKKYSHLGIKYFILDTYKADSDTSNSEAFWFAMQQNMVKIYDTIKVENCNVHIWITFQLAKSSSKQRYYTQDNIGLAKNMVDVASTCIMVRKIFEDEYKDGKHELKVFKYSESGKTKIPVELDSKKNYQILFIVKNRFGSADDYQIVIEHDLSRNTLKEVGITVVPVDF